MALWAAPLTAECRQSLVLGLDVSGSVDLGEYHLQVTGLAEALSDPEVQQRIFEVDAPVRIAVFEWSGPDDQHIIVPPSDITDPLALAQVTRALRLARRSPANPTTAVGSALAFGAELAEGACWRKVLDISGDGVSNTGPRPQDLRDLPADLTVNGLAIGTGTPKTQGQTPELDALVTYFEANVLRGPGAFVERAETFQDYAEAMKRKLLRELQSFAIGAL